MTSVPDAVRSQRKLDAEKLQDVVVRLQEQLIETRQHSRRLEGQLNCLLMLVKKAWTGDFEASEQLSQVVGVPPPLWSNINAADLIGDQPAEGGPPDEDSRWQAEANEASQVLYFRERLGHLNAVMSHHSDLMNGYSRQGSLRPPRPASAKRQPKTLHLRRSSSASSLSRNAEFHGDYLRWRDVIGQREGAASPPRPSQMAPPPPHALPARPEESERRPSSIFDSSSVVMMSPKVPDATAQRFGDDVRSRPKSSSLRHESGRPMKFETTRPVSGALSAKPPSSRPSSGKPPSCASSRQTRSGRKPPARRPPGIDRFSSEESEMREMERNFEATVVDLQRRLGIDDSGIVL